MRLSSSIIALLISFQFFFTSCRIDTTVYRPTIEGVPVAISSEDFKGLKNTTLSIRNDLKETASFYITPTRVDLFSDSCIVQSVLNQDMTDEEKCIALWKFVYDWSYHSKSYSTVDDKVHDPAMFLNGFEGGYCDDRNIVLARLAAKAGIKARVFSLPGHVIAEMYYNHIWHVFDADKQIFYLKEDSSIADVAYLKAHPELIDEAGKKLKTTIAKWRNKQTKAALKSELNNWYEIFAVNRDYSSQIFLNPNEEISFSLAPSNFIVRTVEAELLEKGGPFYVRKGKLITTWYPPKAHQQAKDIIEQYCPYPVTKVELESTCNVAQKVFYSFDSLHWYFKGELLAHAKLDFSTFSSDLVPSTFHYFIKLLDQGQEVGENGKVIIEHNFTFSDKILFNNTEHSFRLVGLNKAAEGLHTQLSFDE